MRKEARRAMDIDHPRVRAQLTSREFELINVWREMILEDDGCHTKNFLHV